MTWQKKEIECKWCKKTHNPHGYGKIHSCPNCNYVSDFSEVEGAWKNE